MAKLKTRTNQPVTDSEGLLDHIAQDGSTTEIGGNLYVDGDVETGGSLELADTLSVGGYAVIKAIQTKQGVPLVFTSNGLYVNSENRNPILELLEDEKVHLSNGKATIDIDDTGLLEIVSPVSGVYLQSGGNEATARIELVGGNVSEENKGITIRTHGNIRFSTTPIFLDDASHTFDIKSAFAFREMTAEEKTQYGLNTALDYFISTTYTQEQVVERILKERLHLLKFTDMAASSYGDVAIYKISEFSPQATDNTRYFVLSFITNSIGKSDLIMLKRRDNIAIFEYNES